MQYMDIIIENSFILTMDENNTTIKNGIIGIKDDEILYAGIQGQEQLQGKKTIDANDCLVLPGLINGHTHAAMTLFRGLADDLPLMEWLENYIFPVEGRMDAEFVHTGAMLACAEMIMSGTTTFCDMYLFEDQVAKTASKAKMRCLAGEVLYDFTSPNYGKLEKGFQYTEWLIDKWHSDPLISIAVEPHSLFTCSPELLIKAGKIAAKHKVPLIIHVAETLHEISLIKEKTGKRPFEYLNALGLLGPDLIAVHCVHLDEEDLQLMAKHDVKVIHNPESNMKLASGIAPVPDILSHGITVGLGTDGCASNNNLDLFCEMDMAAKLQKVALQDPAVMDALTVMRMATIDGARALGLGESIGSLEIGKKADIIIVDLQKPHLTPMYNPYSQLVYAACGNDVRDVIINGDLVMEDRVLLDLDLDKILQKAREKSCLVKLWLRVQQ